MIRSNPLIIRNEQEERVQVRRDLIIITSLNAFFMVVLVGLYFLNRTNGQVEAFFANFFKF